jgi:hypothetical protein
MVYVYSMKREMWRGGEIHTYTIIG